MEFALSEEQRLFEDSLRGLLADRVPIEALRRHAEIGSGFDAGAVAQPGGTRPARACWCRNASAAPGSACWMRRWRRRRWAVPRRSRRSPAAS